MTKFLSVYLGLLISIFFKYILQIFLMSNFAIDYMSVFKVFISIYLLKNSYPSIVGLVWFDFTAYQPFQVI